MAYRPGQRVELLHTDDPYTDLLPGDRGTVLSHDLQRHTVAVSWDTGTDLSMCLDAGDRIRPTDGGAAAATSRLSGTDDKDLSGVGWATIHERLFAAGSQSGRQSADRWARDAFAHQKASDAVIAARHVLVGIEREDPAILAGLPKADVGSLAEFVEQYTGFTPETAPPWSELTLQEREDGLGAYVDGFSMAVVSRVIGHCIAELGERGVVA